METKKRSRSRSNKRQQVQIVYESEEAHAADVFKKYMLNTEFQSKASQKIKNYIESSDYYLQNFKESRESEFSEYDDLDLNRIQQERGAIITALQGKYKGLDIYKINRKKNRGGNYVTNSKFQSIDDIEADQETDEDKLVDLFLKKREGKAKFAEEVRERQQRLLELNDQIRKHDLKQIKDSELDELRSQMFQLNTNWSDLKNSLDEKLKFCEHLHKKHHDEVEDYKKLSDYLDQGNFGQKMKKITFELYQDQRDLLKSAGQMENEREQIRIFLDRAKKDLQEEKRQSEYLKRRLVEMDGSIDKTNQTLKEQIERMKNEMIRINNYSIDIAKNPAQAIQRISDPILELLNVKIEDYGQQLTENLQLKKETQQELIDLKNKIFEEKTAQINLRRRREELVTEFLNLKEDIEIIQDQLSETIKRKAKLAENVQATTDTFEEEAKDLKEELARVKAKLLQVYNHKETVEDQAEFLLDDRGSVGDQRKYEKSINDFIKLAKELKGHYQRFQDKILKLDEDLKIDSMYEDKKGRPRKVEMFYKCGRFAEKEKNDVMIQDVQKKQEFILEQIMEKENLEEQLVAFGSIHHIYKTFKDVQSEIKMDIRKYLREKNQILRYLEELAQDFELCREKIGFQEGDLKQQMARFKAVYFLLQEKVLKMRVLEEELANIQKIINDSDKLNTQVKMKEEQKKEDVNYYERELIMKIEKEKQQKDQEMKAQIDLLYKQDQEIERVKSLIDDKGHVQSQEEILLEEKAKSILKKQGYFSKMEKISKNTYKIGDICYVYLKLKKDALENLVMVKTNVKGDKVKKLREFMIDGELYYEFESFVKAVIVNK